MELGKGVLRLVVGGLFIGHGLQKLTGAFDGPGLEGTQKMAESMGLHPADQSALLVALTETAGGAAIVTGTATPLAAGGLIATMLTAVRKVHLKNGLWNAKGGYEFNLALMAALVALATDGPGKVSMDALFHRSRWGVAGGAFAITVGVVGSLAVVERGKRAAPSALSDDGGPEPGSETDDS